MPINKCYSYEEKIKKYEILSSQYPRCINTYQNRIEKIKLSYNHYSKKYNYHILIENFTFAIDEFLITLVNKIGLNKGDCIFPYKCPAVDVNDKELSELYKYLVEINSKVLGAQTFEEFTSQDENIFSYKHSHTGDWEYIWLEKTGYDFGISMIFFKNEEDYLKAKCAYVLGETYDCL